MAVADAVADRLGDALGLLVDLLEHERLVARALGGLVVPVDLEHVVLDRLARRRVGEGDAVGRDRRDLAVVRELHAARLGEERGEVRGEEVLALAEADDHRRLVPHADELVRMVVVDEDEGEVPFEPRVRRAHRFDEVAVVGVLEQVHDDLGVGLRGEGVAGGHELVPQLAVVLDDPVQDDRQLVLVARRQRMGVLLGDAAVGRPARVAEAGRRDGAVRAGRLLQEREVPDGADVLEAVLLEERDPGRVIAPVLEALQSLQEQRLRGPAADISDDPAHPRVSFHPADAPELPPKASLETQKPGCGPVPASERSAELSANERCDASTGLPRHLRRPPPRRGPGSGAPCRTGARARGPGRSRPGSAARPRRARPA